MNRITKFRTLTIVTSLFILFSCEDIINIELHSVKPQIVIEGVVRMNTLPTVRVSATKDFNSINEYPSIKDAVVEIWDNVGNRQILPFNVDSDKYVATNFALRGIERKTYNLSVNYQGKEYLAESTMLPLVKIDSLTLSTLPLLNYPCPTIHFTSPIDMKKGGYKCTMYINNKTLTNDILISADYMEGKPVHQILPIFFEEEERKNNPIKQGDNIIVEMQCLDADLYKFFWSLDRTDNRMANPINNIKGGALGYFGVYSWTQKGITVE
ncbi:hypothetical protein EZS27_014312 [termite gut metagenome]|jgi:hypothetical protein|uniref:DUF4249 domain-containing protein n=1 Tax=termite gut metagenome TaxID=433724 RepID=A0A5J4RXB0_9ZZZZ